MLTHEQIWSAIDKLAAKKGWSISKLAVQAGLDPTALNLSKRYAPENGKPRWPSTHTLAKVLAGAHTTFGEFCRIVESDRAVDDARIDPQLVSVLLVDDDSLFRQSTAAGLRQAGYTVREAADHRTALDMLEDRDFDLLCTDIVMPDSLGGLALARLALQRRPGLQILYVTGYDIPKLHGSSRVLAKPIDPCRLVAEIGRMIDRQHQQPDDTRRKVLLSA